MKSLPFYFLIFAIVIIQSCNPAKNENAEDPNFEVIHKSNNHYTGQSHVHEDELKMISNGVVKPLVGKAVIGHNGDSVFTFFNPHGYSFRKPGDSHKEVATHRHIYYHFEEIYEYDQSGKVIDTVKIMIVDSVKR